ncbi:MAG: C4-dicarboxylate ABC transporter substrate-binding protein [Ramlibacter sp.]|nr:C4-dicarboxylate ABC transporter substrate-binding protein [Ramlibacter sp.]
MNKVFGWAAWLVLPLAGLLFAQWPLRDWIHAGSREANDLAQILFALYAAVAVTAASRHSAHLAAHGSTGPARPTRWRRWLLALCVAPWAGFVLLASAPEVWASLAHLEHFPETANPGYFLVKLSVWVLALLALIDAVRPRRELP